MAIRHKNLKHANVSHAIRLMLHDIHPSVQLHVKSHQASSIMCKMVVLLPPTVSILIPLYIASAMLLCCPGDHVHVRFSLTFPRSSTVPHPTSATFTPELKNKLSGANTTRCPPIRPASRQVPPGFFDNVQDGGPSSNTHRLHPDPSLHRCRSAFAPPWGSRPRALLVRLTQRFHRFQSNAHEDIELQQRTGPGTSSRSSPPVVDVPALDDKKALYIARRPQRASDKAKHVDNLKWWAHVMLFLCCASPSNDDGH